MRRLSVASERGDYAVVVGRRLLPSLAALLAAEQLPTPGAVVSNRVVGPLYARAAAQALGCGPPLELPDGEPFKRWPQVEAVCADWLARGVHRRQLVLAVGGGVVTDLVGFAAAVYLRGVDWVAVPTTLLGMVDAAIGGKTGVNLDQGKNLVGAFWAPRLVVADVATLETLPRRELAAGLAEVVKAAVIGDRGLLDLLEKTIGPDVDGSSPAWVEVVARAAAVKARVVEADEREAGERQALNLGHTLAHALEAATGYRRFLHGEAVAWGLVAATLLARRRSLLSPATAELLLAAVARLGELPPLADVAVETLLEHLAHDKKRDDLGVAWVLPTEEGVRLGERVSLEELRDVLAELAAGPRT